MARFTAKIWHSPTLMTWGNRGSKVLGLSVLLALALSQLSVEEVNLWLLFQSILIVQGLVEFGFGPTFIRFVAYAQSSEGNSYRASSSSQDGSHHNYEPSNVVRTMRFVYRRLSFVAFIGLATVGSLFVADPISRLASPGLGWIAWVVVMVAGVTHLSGGMYGAYLHGINNIALHQRWQLLATLPAIMTAIILLLLTDSLLALIVPMQVGRIAAILIARRLAILNSPRGIWAGRPLKDKTVINRVWPAAWRSGLGVAMTFGTIQGSGIMYAQVASPAESAAFLLAQNLLRTLSNFANAPFYTRIPTMAKLYAEGKARESVAQARMGMTAVNWIMLAGMLAIGVFADPLLNLMESETSFLRPEVWWLLCIAALAERIGAMHLQLYSTTNHILWHIANGVAGVIMLCMIPLAYNLFGILGIPLGIICGYGLFYVPYSLALSYRQFTLHAIQMDLVASIIPSAVLILIFGSSALT